MTSRLQIWIDILLICVFSPTLHVWTSYIYTLGIIGVFWGVNVGTPSMECLGLIINLAEADDHWGARR